MDLQRVKSVIPFPDPRGADPETGLVAIGGDLLPERFGRVRKYALGKTSGKANIVKNLDEIGLTLDSESLKKVTDRIITLGDKKENVTLEDLPYIISDVLESAEVDEPIKILNYSLSLASGLRPVAISPLAAIAALRAFSIEISGKRPSNKRSGFPSIRL